MAKSMIIPEALRQAQAALASASDAPRLDAERLLLFTLHQTEPQPSHKATAGEASWLYAHDQKELNENQQEEFERVVQERATGKPLAYILGEWEFYGRPFYITPDVLVPRPETENLVEAAHQYINILMQKRDRIVVADIGTGSGIIAVTLARELATPTPSPRQGFGGDSPFARGSKFAPPYEGEGGRAQRDGVVILATDVSPAALEVATKNAQRHGVENHIEFLEGDMLRPLKNRKIDLIVSNPPYIPTAELQSHFAKASRDEIETRGLDFEPKIALDGGADGQDFVREIQQSGIPALVEVTGGSIKRFNF